MIHRLALSAVALLALTAPAFAHEIAAEHGHAGPLVLLALPQAVVLGAVAVAVLALALVIRRRAAHRHGEHDDSR